MSNIGMTDLESCETHGDYTYLIGGDSTCPTCERDTIIFELQSQLTAAHKLVKELEAEFKNLDTSIAEFLDADSAWNKNEIGQDDYVESITNLKTQMYSSRRAAELLKEGQSK